MSTTPAHLFGLAAGPESQCIAPSVVTEAGVTVAIRGNPIWLTDNAAISGAPNPAAAAVAAYRTMGRKLLDCMHGSFALALIDARQRLVLLALDRMGIERLAYAELADGIAFGSSCEQLARHAGVNGSVRPQALYDYLLLHMVPSPDSVFAGVRKLQPGTCVTYQDRTLRVERFWKPVFVEQGRPASAQLEAELLEALRLGVQRAAPDATTGAFLSGGLDSSSVAGMLARVSEQPARTFSIGFGVDEYNELEFAHAAVRHFGFDATEYHVTADDVVTAIPLIAAAHDEPFGNSSAVPTYFCAKIAAERGVTHLLAGDGGDEIFGGNERYAKHRVFELYGRLPATVRAGLVEPLARRIAPDSKMALLRKLRSYVDQAQVRLPERLETWNFVYRADLAAMLEPEFRAAIDPRAPIRQMTDVYDAAQCDSLLNRMLFYDWQYTLADNDLRKVQTMCTLAGVKVSYPMLDPAVIDVSLRVPPDMKMDGGELRSFYRRAVRNFLPGEILNKSKHGFGLPFGVWLKTHAPLRELVLSLLSDLKGRRIIRAKFLDELIEQQRGGDPGYFGYAVWDLALLEAWLEAHTPSRAAPSVP